MEIVKNNLTVRRSAGNDVTVSATGPFHVVYIQVITMSRSIVPIVVHNGLPDVGVIVARHTIDPNRLQDFSPCKDGMCSLMVDVKGSDFGADLGPEACMLRREI
jgi:hypothetical protein